MIHIPANTIARHKEINRELTHISVKNGNVRLVTTDRKYMAVELIDEGIPGAWEATIRYPDGDAELNPLPMIGAIFHGTVNLMVTSPHEYANWSVIPQRADTVTENHGFLFMDTNNLQQLAASSPSGHIIWPKIIDTRQPIVLNDEDDPRWNGYFNARNENYSNDIKPAMVAGWAL